MYLVFGNVHLKNGDYEGAMQLFARAQTQVQRSRAQPPLVVSLVSFITSVSRRIKITHRWTDNRMEI